MCIVSDSNAHHKKDLFLSGSIPAQNLCREIQDCDPDNVIGSSYDLGPYPT